ncbi:hypothetical protein M5X02_30735 [Paenibacillus alvei]|uniref:hypothetical protein n=1 Tax=Paenibacillus alvei TaxID=44250 RepID=UPI00028A3928|nr:hypothetical protein [Paenibacillus alvei]EJW13956.1 hypothetical protein PAV_141p00620 [Paenibacillus alvei DSM 29]MCY9545004.1 hypothetical protein [Paenibacillus alvei]MCY9707681.1 hypothetical protein [Paenibacillus alvei]MEC0082806.1 hypothetical protein [Paenibacillus alvei]
MSQTLRAVKATYEEQIQRLKQAKKDGNVCSKQYKIQLSIWEKRVKQYEQMIRDTEGL